MWACSFEMMRSRIWIVLSGCRPIVLKAASSNSCRSSPEITISLAIGDARKTAHSMLRAARAGSKATLTSTPCPYTGNARSGRRPSCVPDRLVAISCPRRDRGGIGRRAGLRCQWVTLWGFESPRSHDLSCRKGSFFVPDGLEETEPVRLDHGARDRAVRDREDRDPGVRDPLRGGGVTAERM